MSYPTAPSPTSDALWFFDELSAKEKREYQLMLETNYVLLGCDLVEFEEVDENDVHYKSVSWARSIRKSNTLWGFSAESYPQGSLSANRHYFQALLNYWNGDMPTKPFNGIHRGILNFLKLRRDDSSSDSSYLYGSSYVIEEDKSNRFPTKKRKTEFNLRHSASALWILAHEFDELSGSFEESLRVVASLSREYCLDSPKKKERVNEYGKHLTISCLLGLFHLVCAKFETPKELIEDLSSMIPKLHDNLFLADIIVGSERGSYEGWKLQKDHNLETYQYYLDLFVLNQIPWILQDERARQIVDSILKNAIELRGYYGIPTCPRGIDNAYDLEQIDFGATSGVAFSLWYVIANKLGDDLTLTRYREVFLKLLRTLLKMYHSSENYILPHSENCTKILLLPRVHLDSERSDQIEQYIVNVRRVLSDTKSISKRKYLNEIKKVSVPDGLDCIPALIGNWELENYTAFHGFRASDKIVPESKTVKHIWGGVKLMKNWMKIAVGTAVTALITAVVTKFVT